MHFRCIAVVVDPSREPTVEAVRQHLNDVDNVRRIIRNCEYLKYELENRIEERGGAIELGYGEDILPVILESGMKSLFYDDGQHVVLPIGHGLNLIVGGGYGADPYDEYADEMALVEAALADFVFGRLLGIVGLPDINTINRYLNNK